MFTVHFLPLNIGIWAKVKLLLHLAVWIDLVMIVIWDHNILYNLALHSHKPTSETFIKCAVDHVHLDLEGTQKIISYLFDR